MNLARRFRGRKTLLHRIPPNHPSQDGTAALINGSPAYSADSARYWNNIVIGLRRHTQGRIVNGWLVLIVALGAVIAIADGLTRTPFLEREAIWNGPLEYEPYSAALLFAGMTFPLMFAYARKARIPASEGLFLWFMFCTTAYTRDFSYIRWPGAPLFVTDVVLLVLLLSICVFPQRRYSRLPLWVNLFLILFLAAGVLSSARGFSGHRDPVLVLRDSALVVYPLFLPVAHHLFRSWLSIKRALVWFLVGTALGALNGLTWFVVDPEERRFIFYGIYALISLVGVLVAIFNGLVRGWVGWVFATLLSVGVMLANARSLFVALAVLAFLGLLRGTRGTSICGKVHISHSLASLLTPTLLAILAVSPFVWTQGGRDFVERSGEELASGILNSGMDDNWEFRLAAWREGWRRFENYPLGGEGFGIPFNFEIWNNDPRPHNTFLTVLYKMGLTGFLQLFAVLVCFFWLGLRALHRNSANHRAPFLQIVILAQVSFCVFGGANSVLESPFLASLFWAGMGLGLRMIYKLDLETLLGAHAHAHW